MREEIYLERGERLAELAGQANSLHARILEAREQLVEARERADAPRANMRTRSRLERYSDQAERAELLAKKAGSVSESLVAAAFEEPQEEPPQRPAPRQKRRQQNVTGKNDEELAVVTNAIIAGARTAVDRIHDDYSSGTANQEQRKQFLGSETMLHFSKGSRIYQEKVRNPRIVAQDNLTQTVIWTAQANGPRQAPFKQTPAERAGFVLDMINLGKANMDSYLDATALWELIDEAREIGLLGGDEDDPKLTAKGLRHIEEILGGSDRPNPFNPR